MPEQKREDFDYFEERLNPLDSVEDLLSSHNWHFDRMSSEELVVLVTGKSCKYRMYFVWQEDMNALQLCFQYDLNIEHNNGVSASAALRTMNESLWMGHFELSSETNAPAFRYTAFFKNADPAGISDTLEDIVDVALVQCERFFPVFQLLAMANDIDDAGLSLALMDTAGES